MYVQVNVKVQGGFKQTLESGHQRVGTGTMPAPRVKQNLTVNKCIDPGVSYSIPKRLQDIVESNSFLSSNVSPNNTGNPVVASINVNSAWTQYTPKQKRMNLRTTTENGSVFLTARGESHSKSPKRANAPTPVSRVQTV